MKHIATIASILAGLAVAGAFTVMSTGCCAGGNCAGARADAATTADVATSVPAEAVTTAPETETTEPDADTMDAMDSDSMSESDESMMMEEAGVHFVLGGESLWSIAALEEVFADPFMWPLLLKSNLDQIEDADLIYPGQELTVPAGDSPSDVALAVEHAKTRGAWFMGLIEATDQEYLRAAIQ